MKKIFGILVFIALILTSSKEAHSASLVAGSSATLTYGVKNEQNAILERKKQAIYSLLKRNNSPLAAHTDAFIEASIKYNLDPYLLPSIAGLESGFGVAIMPSSNNPFGWGGGTLVFKTWDEAILTVAQGIRENYMDRGATSIEAIGHIYAPPSTTWSSKVHFFMRQFNAEEEKQYSLPVTL